jgi:hypothetical protein
MVTGTPPTGGYAYGLALTLGFWEGFQRFAHDGDLSPFTSRLTFYPQLGLGIFTATNGPGLLPPEVGHSALHDQIVATLIGRTTDGVVSSSHSSKRDRKVGKGRMSVPDSKVQISEVGWEPQSLVGIYGHPYEGI